MVYLLYEIIKEDAGIPYKYKGMNVKLKEASTDPKMMTKTGKL